MPELREVEGIVLTSSADPVSVARTASAPGPARTVAAEPSRLHVPWIPLALALAFVSGLQTARRRRRRWAPRPR